MTAETIQPTSEVDRISFIGLEAYTEKQAEVFFGRDEEIKTLYKLVKSNTLTIVFGKSGTGKTSLLNAGVFPRLRNDYCLPFRIRLEFNDKSPGLVEQVKQVMKQEIDEYGFNVRDYPGNETLWEYFHKEPLWTIVTPVLIFDQFEEIFTLAANNARYKKEQVDDFIEELSDVIENSIPEKIKERFINGQEDDLQYHKPKAKVILSFREDFLAEIEGITAKIPSVKNSRFRLLPMNGVQAMEVITRTWGPAIQPKEAKKIISFFTADEVPYTGDESLENITVEPSLLSQVCSFLESRRKEQGKATISADLLAVYTKETTLRNLYDDVLQEGAAAISLPTTEKTNSVVTGNPIKIFIEEKLLTDDGFRIKYDLVEAEPWLLPGIDIVKRKYFLREENNSVEITHDVIVDLVKKDREDRRKAAADLAAKKKANRKAALVIIAAAIIAICGFAAATYQARHTNEVLGEENKKLNNSIEKLKKDTAQLNDSIDNKRDILARMGNGPSRGKGDNKSLQSRDSLLTSYPVSPDTLPVTNVVNTEQAERIRALAAENERLRNDLTNVVQARRNLETELNTSKLDLANTKRQNGNINIELNNNKKMLELWPANFAKLQDENKMALVRIEQLQKENRDLKTQLSKATKSLDPIYISSDKKRFGYGYDYAEDKIKKKQP